MELGGVPLLMRAVSFGLSSCAPAGAASSTAGSASLASSLVLSGRSALLQAGPPAEAGPGGAGLLLHAAAALARVASGHAVAQQLLARCAAAPSPPTCLPS